MSNGVSIVEGGGIFKTSPVKEVYVEEALDIIRSDKYKETVEKIRNSSDPKEKRGLKEGLDYFMFGGTFLKRGNKDLIKASGIVVLDFDHVSDDFKSDITNDKHVHFVFRSPSGDGFKAGIKIPVVEDDEEYKKYWYALAEHFSGAETADASCKDISRACFVSWDDELYYNKDSVEFTEMIEKPVSSSIYPQITPESLSNSTFASAVRDAWLPDTNGNTNRQNLCMSVAGYLRKDNRMRWGLKRTMEFVRGICEETKDEETNKRLEVVKQTYDKDESELVGYQGLPDSIKAVIARDEITENKEEADGYRQNEVNWTDDPYYNNSWKRLKMKTLSQLKSSDFLFQLFSSNGKITGKPQIRDSEVKTSIKLVIKAIKPDKELGDIVNYKLIDDNYNKNYDGYEEDAMIKNYWVYDVVDDGINHLVFCEEKLENHEVHDFFGTAIQVSHAKELQKNLSFKGTSNVFFCQKAESSIKPRPQEELIPYVKRFMEENDIGEEDYKKTIKDYIFTHPDGYVYNQPENYALLRNAVLLSAKNAGIYGQYPAHLFVWGGVGLGKTLELECMDRIFGESILEAANSTPKALVPSFKEAVVAPGFLLSCNRVALIDELMKMVDNVLSQNKGHSDVKNQFANLNFLLEHKTRRANSGNGNLYCMPTSKVFAATNPSQKSKYFHQEFTVLDKSTISRIIPYVKGAEYVKFLRSNTPQKPAMTKKGVCSTNTSIPLYPFNSVIGVFRPFYVSIYDSCQHFASKVCEKKVQTLHQSCLNLATSEMKKVWAPRGKHHIFLIVDGLVKYRCLFEDFDPSFEAKTVDYDRAEKILIEMVNNWSYDMTSEGEEFE